MASRSIAESSLIGRTRERVKAAAALPYWAILMDAAGVIQSQEGQWPALNGTVADGDSYYDSADAIYGKSQKRAAAVAAGICAVAAGQADSFRLEFPGRLQERDTLVRVTATYSDKCVLVLHSCAEDTEETAEAPGDSQAHKMETLGRLAGGVAHDFANLVTLLSGYSEILLNRLRADDPARPELEEIRKAAARASGVTSQILDFIRKQAAVPALVNLNTLVAEVYQLFRPVIGEHITLVTALEPNPGTVQADPAQMTRVIMNLVLNARDAMPHGGRITLSTANVELGANAHQLRPGRYISLKVADTGCGMGRETLRKMFQPFFTTKLGSGTGLGLSTVRRIVRQAKGAVWAESETGHGATLTVCLPRSGTADEAADCNAVPCGAVRGTETILLAEDDEGVRTLLRRLLTANGYQVLEASDGEDAWRIFKQHSGSIDLLLTDVVMPGMNGSDLVQKAVTSRPRLKVIYMSGYTGDLLQNAGIPRPGVSFLRKPLQLGVLSSLIRELLDSEPK